VTAEPTGFQYQRTEAGLAAAAFLAPFSATQLAGSLTVGRVAVLGFAALLGADLLRIRPGRFRIDAPTAMLAAAYVGLSAWILLSSATWGCNCGGKASGILEFAAIGVLALVAIGFEPRLRGPAMVATLGGLGLASVLALLGVGSLNSGTVDLTQTGGRLSGTFGNANELGFAAALGIPIALAYAYPAGRNGRIALGAIAALLAGTIVLSYSRGAVIAAAVGSIALALWLSRGSWRRIGAILAVAAVGVALAAVLYSVFQDERKEASFETVSPALAGLDRRDLSGWDSRALGPIPNGPSTLLSRQDGIAVRGTRDGEGASFRWGEARAGGEYTLVFRARSDRAGLPFAYALGDSSREADDRESRGTLDPRWRRFSLAWRPHLRSPHATLYIWQRGGASTFELTDIEVSAAGPQGGAGVVAVPDRLEGSIYDRLTTTANRSETRYLQSRLDAARLAFRAFRSDPLTGIGWATFPEYSDTHLEYGELAAHDQYLSIAAELGIVGVLLLGLLIAAIVVGAGRTGTSRPEAAAVGVLAAAAAGLVFVEALPTPQLSIPIAFAAAVVCAQRRRAAD
jgi:O-Antigen ligase